MKNTNNTKKKLFLKLIITSFDSNGLHVKRSLKNTIRQSIYIMLLLKQSTSQGRMGEVVIIAISCRMYPCSITYFA